MGSGHPSDSHKKWGDISSSSTLVSNSLGVVGRPGASHRTHVFIWRGSRVCSDRTVSHVSQPWATQTLNAGAGCQLHISGRTPQSRPLTETAAPSADFHFWWKWSQRSVRKTHSQQRSGARFAETETYATGTGSAPLIQEQVGLPESCSRQMWSFFPEHTSISTGADGLRSSAGIKHSTWKTITGQCPFHFKVSEKKTIHQIVIN